MRVIALTGGIATGKSTVARHLAELGACVIDADLVAREVVEPGEPTLDQLVATFGPDILTADGRLDRQALAAKTFGNPEAVAAMNRIMHPEIRRRILKYRDEAVASGRYPVVVLDIPLFFETGAQYPVDEVWVVAAGRDLQKMRVMERNGLPEEQVEARLSAQMPVEEKVGRADVVLRNAGTLEELHAQVLREWRRLTGAP